MISLQGLRQKESTSRLPLYSYTKAYDIAPTALPWLNDILVILGHRTAPMPKGRARSYAKAYDITNMPKGMSPCDIPKGIPDSPVYRNGSDYMHCITPILTTVVGLEDTYFVSTLLHKYISDKKLYHLI